MKIEIRNNSVLLDGYVNAVGRESRVLPSPNGKFIELIVPKTFEKALLKGTNVDLLFNHNKSRLLGSTSQGTLELREDNIGLRATATVSDPEVMKKAKNGELRGWSFGMCVNKDLWTEGTDGIQKRSIEDLDLFEVSVLDMQPAYIATSIETRDEASRICERRSEDFTAKIEDKSVPIEEPKKQEEIRIDTPDYSLNEHEITILRMKGSLKK